MIRRPVARAPGPLAVALTLVRTLALTLALTGPARSQDADMTSPALTLVDTGLVCNPVVLREEPAPGTVSGVVNVLEEVPEFTVDSRRVPAVIGLSFGALARAEAREFPVVDMVVTHPPMGPTGATMQTYTTYFGRGGTTPVLYSLEYDEELVLGTWTFEARAEGEVLYRLSFEVVPPQALPELAAMCGYEDLLS